jgi:CelD/BcsL family acetyltransferase involved in cellulose biosynthesis
MTTGVTVARTAEEARAWRPWWERLPLGDVDAELDYFLTVAAHDPRVLRPHVMRVVPEAGEPVLVAARLVDQRFGAKVAGRQVGGVAAPALVVAFDGVVGAATAAQRRAVTDAVSEHLIAGEADVAVFQMVESGTRWADHLRSRVGVPRLLRPPTTRWFTDLPDSWEELLSRRTARSRRQIRYDDNKLRRAYGDRLALRRLDRPVHEHRLVDDLSAVAAVSYQRGLGVSFLDNPVQAALMTLARDKGWLRVWMLYVDDAPVAFWWGVAHAGVLSIGSPGFDPAYARDRVGYYTLRRMLEDAADDRDLHRIDYGPGQADYKERFATGSSIAQDVLLFARRPRPMAVRTMLSAQDRTLALARSTAEASGRAEELRRWWRTRNAPVVRDVAADA